MRIGPGYISLRLGAEHVRTSTWCPDRVVSGIAKPIIKYSPNGTAFWVVDDYFYT